MQIVGEIILHGLLPCLHYGRFHDDCDVDVDGDGDGDDDGDDGDLRDDNDDKDINEEAGKLGGWRMMWWK